MPDFECLIVDDGSSDHHELARVVSGLNDPRFRIIYQANGGGGSARNAGINAAQANYVAFLDSDDYFLPTKLSACRAAIERRPFALENTVLFSQVIVDRGGTRTWIKPPRAPKDGERVDDYLILRGGFIQTSTIVMERSLAAEVRFDPALPFGQDTDFCVRLAAHGCKFEMLPEPLVIWIDSSAPNRVSSTRRVDALLHWTDRVKPLLSDKSFLAYRGWHGAKAALASGHLRLASTLFMKAIVGRAFSPSLAIKVALQLAVPPQLYRQAANLVVRLLGKNTKGTSW